MPVSFYSVNVNTVIQFCLTFETCSKVNQCGSNREDQLYAENQQKQKNARQKGVSGGTPNYLPSNKNRSFIKDFLTCHASAPDMAKV